EERDAFIAQVCGQDDALRKELTRWIRAAEDETPGLEQPPINSASSSDAPSLPDGRVLLGRFQILRFLGRGGMGEVYEANDRELGRIALKSIRPEIAGNRHILARFRQEVQ